MNILHITAHLGGGAGKAISGMAVQGQRQFPDRHRVLLLQEPEKSGYVQVCREGGVETQVWTGGYETLDWADVVAVSWWNHPCMARFLYEMPPFSVPLVLWSHVNGCHYPCLPSCFADAFDGILFTSPYALENPAWTDAERARIRERAQIVYGMGAFYPGAFVPKTDYKNRDHFTVGYAGTLNYGKLHPEFVEYCRSVCERVPEARFVMAGDRDRRLEQDIQSAGLAERFCFPGFVTDVPALMRSFDVFGYLLNPEHYGTTENVLLEAMACGVPVAALRQNVEQYIVPGDAGCLVETPRQYGEAMEALRGDPARRADMGRHGRMYVEKCFCTETNTAAFREACAAAAGRRGEARRFSFMGETPWQWFLLCAGEENRKRFEEIRALCHTGRPGDPAHVRALLRACPPIFKERRKSSLRHFAESYPEDRTLQMICKAMEESQNGRC